MLNMKSFEKGSWEAMNHHDTFYKSMVIEVFLYSICIDWFNRNEYLMRLETNWH